MLLAVNAPPQTYSFSSVRLHIPPLGHPGIRLMPVLKHPPAIVSEVETNLHTHTQTQVINGQHAGEAGMLLAVNDDASELCVMISDTSRQQIRVFARDLTMNTDADTGVETLGEYCLHDLVQLDQTTAGVIIKVGVSSCLEATQKLPRSCLEAA
jgi:hypothetical protein